MKIQLELYLNAKYGYNISFSNNDWVMNDHNITINAKFGFGTITINNREFLNFIK